LLVYEPSPIKYFTKLNGICWVSWPKIQETARWDHTTQTWTCQDEGARRREMTENQHGGTVSCGTVVPRVSLLGTMVAARVSLDIQFLLTARVRLQG